MHQGSFDKLKQAMINATHLSAINPRQQYHLYTDAWKECVAVTLVQRCAHGKYKGHLRPIAFMSRKMQPAKTRYPIREQELLAIVLALKQWFHPLRGPQQVYMHTDHESLRYLTTSSMLAPFPRGIQPHAVVCTGPGEPSSRRLFLPDFATVDGHRECYTYTGLCNTLGRELGFTGRRTCR